MSHKQSIRCVIVFLVLACITARAQIGLAEETSGYQKDHPYRERTALAISLAPTVVGFVLVSGALIGIRASVEQNAEPLAISAGAVGVAALAVGPSIGYFYARKHARGFFSMIIRTALSGVLGLGVYWLTGSMGPFGGANAGGGFAMIMLAGPIIITSAIIDLVQVQPTVRKANREYQSKKQPVSLSPAVMGIDKENTAWGLCASGSF